MCDLRAAKQVFPTPAWSTSPRSARSIARDSATVLARFGPQSCAWCFRDWRSCSAPARPTWPTPSSCQLDLAVMVALVPQHELEHQDRVVVVEVHARGRLSMMA